MNNNTQRNILNTIILLLVFAVFLCACEIDSNGNNTSGNKDNSADAIVDTTVHLDKAEELVQNILPENNEYAHADTYVTWGDSDNGAVYSNRSDCSSFVTHLLMYSYDLSEQTFTEYFSEDDPEAEDYYDTITQQNGFTLITNIASVLPGDFIAVKYLDPEETNTGHMMLFASSPSKRESSDPLVDSTEQWEVEVIDSSASGHGPLDTRKNDEGFYEGVGKGTIRLYTYSDGTYAGYTWSTYGSSEYRNSDYRPFVVGRITDSFVLSE